MRLLQHLWRLWRDGHGQQRAVDGRGSGPDPDGVRVDSGGSALRATPHRPLGSLSGAAADSMVSTPAVAFREEDVRYYDHPPDFGPLDHSFETEVYQRLTDFGEWPVWLPDNRRILFVYEGTEFFIVDLESGETEKVFSVTRDVIGPPRIPADASRVFFSRRATEADIWLLSFEAE